MSTAVEAPIAATAQQVLVQVITSYMPAQAVYVAAKLGIADLLKDGPQSAGELAATTAVHERSLYRVLRALASLGIFSERSDGRFELTPAAECLRSDVPGSLRDLAIFMGEPWHFRVFGETLSAVETGQRPFDRVFGMEPFEYFTKNPEAAQSFHRAMVSLTSTIAPAVVEAYDFSGVDTVVDVAGGHGQLICTVLKAHPAMQGILFDLPKVIDGAGQHVVSQGVAPRCKLVRGSFFESVPAGGDVYMLKHIIHDWDDKEAREILVNCRRAVGPNSKLLLVEAVVPPGNEPSFSKILDLEMLLIPGGRERTEAEYRELLAAAGFRLARVLATKSSANVLEAFPA